MTIAELEAAIEDWEEVYERCKLRADTGPLPILKQEYNSRIEFLKKYEEEIFH